MDTKQVLTWIAMAQLSLDKANIELSRAIAEKESKLISL